MKTVICDHAETKNCPHRKRYVKIDYGKPRALFVCPHGFLHEYKGEECDAKNCQGIDSLMDVTCTEV